MSDFTSLVKARRSAMKFIPDVHISEAELEEIFNLVKFAPSADNLQHTHYVVINDAELKDITIGKEDVSKPRPRGYRKPINEFVNYNTFIAQSDI